jgi:hypothetical protein
MKVPHQMPGCALWLEWPVQIHGAQSVNQTCGAVLTDLSVTVLVYPVSPVPTYTLIAHTSVLYPGLTRR